MPIDQATAQNNLLKFSASLIWFGVCLGLFGESIGLLIFAFFTHDQNYAAVNIIMATLLFIPLLFTSILSYRRFRQLTEYS